MRQFIAPLALAQKRAGYEVICACAPGPYWQELEALGLTMIPLKIARTANPISAIGSVLEVAYMLRDHMPDIFHVHTPIASMIGRLGAFIARTPRTAYTVHGFYFHDQMPMLKRWFHIALERAFAPLTDHVFCVSREDYRAALRLGIGKKRKTFLVGNGADPRRFDIALRAQRSALREELRIPADALVITIVGRLVHDKGHAEFFIAAKALAARFPSTHFVIIGDTLSSEHDDAKQEIMRYSCAVPAGRVHFLGMRNDVERLLAATDIFCLPSHREGLPVSIIEAMMMGLPTVTTRIRGCRELIRDGIDGLLVEPKNPRQLEESLATLIEQPDLARKCGDNAHARALAHFNEEKILARELRICERILA
ncbi:glycosyltransferase family 4 protein [Candidatus Sumerlaeota bacterium]|nr:glycosyltransferase family 4 protein [Candidatus Sumerlaeota bacterium]